MADECAELGLVKHDLSSSATAHRQDEDLPALTIGAAGALLFQLGIGKEVLAPIWDRLRLGK